MTEETLLEAIALAREGRKAEARWLLDHVLQEDRENETAWLWYADCAETLEDRRCALESCLRANPNALRARAGLRLLYKVRQLEGAPSSIRQSQSDQEVLGESIVDPGGQAVSRSLADLASMTFVAVTGSTKWPEKTRAGDEPLTNDEKSILTDPFKESTERLLAEVWGIHDESVNKCEGVFTIPPDAVTEEEFSEVEERESSFLAAHSDLHPLHNQHGGRRKPLKRTVEDWEDLSRTGNPRVLSHENVPTQPVRKIAPANEPLIEPTYREEPVAHRPFLDGRSIFSLLGVVMMVLVLAVLLGAALAISL